ncbi:hypothetical protein D3Y57_11990 [Sphingomonas paeninsulae]|uniref:Uncharacterized protein n=1 Tax=Sphingomonas paeninsulae TaxID=2319844 RepID=A0A494TM93_SPHPE|nr:hypothetical protein D3Y57_11990 [Sphingomonas paeninsulae]
MFRKTQKATFTAPPVASGLRKPVEVGMQEGMPGVRREQFQLDVVAGVADRHEVARIHHHVVVMGLRQEVVDLVDFAVQAERAARSRDAQVVVC